MEQAERLTVGAWDLSTVEPVDRGIRLQPDCSTFGLLYDRANAVSVLPVTPSP
jgi:hypothetical protein